MTRAEKQVPSVTRHVLEIHKDSYYCWPRNWISTRDKDRSNENAINREDMRGMGMQRLVEIILALNYRNVEVLREDAISICKENG